MEIFTNNSSVDRRSLIEEMCAAKINFKMSNPDTVGSPSVHWLGPQMSDEILFWCFASSQII
uniref:Uncharacterized protein n=1 Tax=Anopheles quadriannulatus TaxID=34691 RepID=A0A182X0E8_ANOQN